MVEKGIPHVRNSGTVVKLHAYGRLVQNGRGGEGGEGGAGGGGGGLMVKVFEWFASRDVNRRRKLWTKAEPIAYRCLRTTSQPKRTTRHFF